MKSLREAPDICAAAKAGNLEQVQSLIASPQWDPFVPAEGGFTPLTCAAAGGNVEIIRLMVDNGASVNQRDINRVSPLEAAQKAGHADAVTLLQELGATE